MKFFKKLLIAISVIRLTLIDIGFWVLVIILVGLFSGDDNLNISGETLLIRPSGNIVESPGEPDIFTILNSGEDMIPQDVLLRDILDAINLAKDDLAIKSIILDLDYLGYAGFSAVQEIGKALTEFKDSGKKIYSYSSFYSQSHYYLSSFSDEIVMDPYGEISLNGLGVYRNYWKDTLDKFDVDVQVFRAGEYKSYVEPYISTSMSEVVKKQNLLWMGSIWDNTLDAIKKNRSLKADALNRFTQDKLALLKEYKGDSSKLALKEGFVDQLKTRDEFYEPFPELYDFNNYLIDKRGFSAEGNIAVITLEGVISHSSNKAGYISALQTVDLIERAIDDGAKGLVIRINSGGGGAYASEVIRRKVEKINEEIPVLISMGDVCASGGYWIATAGDYILAESSTITGSIGVFGLALGLENTLKNNLGVHNDGVGTTPYAANGDISKNLSEEVVGIYQLGVDDVYNKFLKLVSDNRDISIDELKSIAGGRVWSGEQALELGLVDELGGWRDIKGYFKEVLNSEDINLVYYDNEEPVFGQFINSVFASVSIRDSFVTKLLNNSVAEEISLFQEIKDPKNTYALWY